MAARRRGESIAHLFLISSQAEVWISNFAGDRMTSALRGASDFIGRLSELALSGLKASQAWQHGNERGPRWHRSRCSVLVASVYCLKAESQCHRRAYRRDKPHYGRQVNNMILHCKSFRMPFLSNCKCIYHTEIILTPILSMVRQKN